MKKFIFFVMAFLSGTLLHAGSVSIHNDSPYPLHIEVLSASGVSQGKLQVAPQQQATWTDTSGYQATWSQTPYSVIFTCSTGEVYGVFSGVSPGALVTASASTGSHYCKPQKKGENGQGEQEQTPAMSPEHLRKDPIWGPP